MVKIDMKWSGMLTVKNIEQVADLLRKLLNGKRYTFVAAHESRGFKPEVRTNQKLNSSIPGVANSIRTYCNNEEGKQFAGFLVNDSYGVWGCSTCLLEDTHDPKFKNPHIEFDGDKVTIIHRPSARNKLYWVAAIERD